MEYVPLSYYCMLLFNYIIFYVECEREGVRGIEIQRISVRPCGGTEAICRLSLAEANYKEIISGYQPPVR